MKKILSILLALGCLAASAQDYTGKAEFDRKVHNFGTVSIADGPVSCTFKVTNTAEDSPLVIYAVVSSCGCTGVDWTRTEIAPGQSGTISATYSNDEGPYAFDKTLTAYTSDKKKPTVLHIKGTAKK